MNKLLGEYILVTSLSTDEFDGALVAAGIDGRQTPVVSHVRENRSFPTYLLSAVGHVEAHMTHGTVAALNRQAKRLQ
jgi:hypothetical protein